MILVNCTGIKKANGEQSMFGFTVIFPSSLGEAKNSTRYGVQFSPVMQMEVTGTAAVKPSLVRSALVT